MSSELRALLPRARPGGAPPRPAAATDRDGGASQAAARPAERLAGAIALIVIVGLSLAVVIVVANRPSALSAITRPHFFPGWLAGPLGGLWPQFTRSPEALNYIFTGVVVVMYVCYLAGIRYIPKLGARWVIAGLIAVQVIFFLAPPLTLTDVFNYINYARMEVVHNLNPYATIPMLEPHSDPAFVLSNWHSLLSPYGPLFTILTFAAVPFGVPASFWAVKVIMALFNLGILTLVWKSARLLDLDPLKAVVFTGLNPVVLLWGLGGDHNDFVMVFLVMLACYALLRAFRRDAPRMSAGPPPAGNVGAGGSPPGGVAADATARGHDPSARAVANGSLEQATMAHDLANGSLEQATMAHDLANGSLNGPGHRAPAGRSAATSSLAASAAASGWWATVIGWLLPLAGLEMAAGAALAAAVFVKASAGIVVPVVIAGVAGRSRRSAVQTVLGGIFATIVLGIVSYMVFGAHIPNLGTQGSIVTDLSLPNLMGLALGFGGESTALREVLVVALIASVALCCVAAYRKAEFLTASAFSTIALLVTLAWVLPWYVLWVLPLAALSRSRKLRAAVILLSIYMIIVGVPATTNLFEAIGFEPAQTPLGQQHHLIVRELID